MKVYNETIAMTPEPKQTAVEWLRKQIAPIVHDKDHQELLDVCEQALKMEREQIVDALVEGTTLNTDSSHSETSLKMVTEWANEYYNQTYGKD